MTWLYWTVVAVLLAALFHWLNFGELYRLCVIGAIVLFVGFLIVTVLGMVKRGDPKA